MKYSTGIPTHGYAPTKVERELNRVVPNNREIDSLREAKNLLKGYDGDIRLKEIIDGILGRIPEAATLLNKLADKDWVNNKVSEADAEFKGTYASLEALQRIPADRNDFGYVIRVQDNNHFYDKYKYVVGTGYLYEYTISQNSFTAAEWAAIQSGITLLLVQRLQELDELVGDKVLVGIERGEDGTWLGVFRQLAQEGTEEDNNN